MNVVEARCLCYDDDINYSTYPETESNDIEVSWELRVADEVITKMELDLACAAEKLVNLSIHMMRVSLKEAEFEASNSLGDSVETLEFDLLCSFVVSQVTEVEFCMKSVHQNAVEAHKLMSSFRHLGEKFMSMEVRLREAEESLKQSQDQILEIQDQSTKFETTLHHLKGTQTSGNSKNKGKIKMESGKQKRYILRMLEKSLAREMELENKLSQAKQIQQHLNSALMLKEEQLNDACERWFEAENVAEVHQYFEREAEISEKQEEEEEQTLVSTSDHSEPVEEDESSESSEELIVGQSQALANHTVNLDGWNWGWDFNFAIPSSLFKI